MREHLAFSSDSWPFNASCRNTGCTERNLWCWWWWWCGIGKHNTRVHLHVHTNNAAGIILTGMQVVEHRERERGVGKEMEKVEEEEEEDSVWEGPVAAHQA